LTEYFRPCQWVQGFFPEIDNHILILNLHGATKSAKFTISSPQSIEEKVELTITRKFINQQSDFQAKEQK